MITREQATQEESAEWRRRQAERATEQLECDRRALDYWARMGRRDEYDDLIQDIQKTGRQMPDVPWLNRPYMTTADQVGRYH